MYSRSTNINNIESDYNILINMMQHVTIGYENNFICNNKSTQLPIY